MTNKNGASHTPTPWKVVDGSDAYLAIVGDKSESHLADYIDKSDAAFIVRAVNSHDELLAALKKAVASNLLPHLLDCEAIKAIAKAERGTL